MNSNKKFGLIAINDEETNCNLCGKTELQKVMWIIELDVDGSPIGIAEAFGTTCGAKLLKITNGKMNTKIKNFQDQKNSKNWELKQQKQKELGNDLIVENWNKQGLNFRERKATQEWNQLIENNRIASEWANNQEIIIELN